MFREISITASLIFGVAASAGAYAADTAWDYAQECVNELGLGTIPSFTCNDTSAGNIWVASMQAWIGTLDTGNPDVDAVFLCRTGVGDRSGLNGLIIHNRQSDKACFFDAAHSSVSTPMISLRDSNKTAVNNAWMSPSQMKANGVSNCQNCHGNDPIIASTNLKSQLQQLGLMDNGRKLTGPVYHVVGSQLTSWNDDLAEGISDNSQTCALACHRMSTNMAGNASMPPNGPSSGYVPYLVSLPIASDFDSGDPLVLFPSVDGEGDFWTRRTGPTPSSGTGPQGANDTFMYIETSGGYPMNTSGTVALMETNVAWMNDVTVSLDYHMYGSDIGHLTIDIWSNMFNNWMSVAGQSYNAGSSWQNWSVDLSGYSFVMAGPSKVRIRANSVGGWRGDIAIDNFLLQQN